MKLVAEIQLLVCHCLWYVTHGVCLYCTACTVVHIMCIRSIQRVLALWKNQGGDRSEVQEQLQQAKGDAWLFYGVAKWARGQLEGEIRAGLWGLAHATPRELMLHVSPEQLWSRIMHQEPHTVRFLAL